MSSKKKQRIFAFDRMNFILLAVGMAVVIIGFILKIVDKKKGIGLEEPNIKE